MNDKGGPEAASESLATAKSLDETMLPEAAARGRFSLVRVLDRRRAARELDKLLGVDRRPDIAEVYGRTAALARMLEAEAS